MAHTTFTASDPRQRTDLHVVDHDTRGLTFVIRSDDGAELRAHVADPDDLLDALAGPEERSQCEALAGELEKARAERDRARVEVKELREDIRRVRASAPASVKWAAGAPT